MISFGIQETTPMFIQQLTNVHSLALVVYKSETRARDVLNAQVALESGYHVMKEPRSFIRKRTAFFHKKEPRFFIRIISGRTILKIGMF